MHIPSFSRRRAQHRRPPRRGGTTPLWRDQPLLAWATAAVVAAILVLGGGPTRASLPYAIEFVLGIGLLGLVLWQSGGAVLRRMPWPVLGLVVALLALPLIQLVPLPPGWEQPGPARGIATALRALAGEADRWQPLTLVPQTTVQVAFSLVILLGVLLAALSLDTRGIRLIVALVLAVEALTVVIGVLQLTSAGRLFDFYDSAHRLNLLGFFANRNHSAVFLGCAIPLSVAFLSTGRAPPRALLGLSGMIALGVLIAVFGTVSRTGIVLTVAGFLLSLLLLVPLPAGRGRLVAAASVAGAAVFGILLFTSSAVSKVFERYADVGDDLRWRFYVRTWALVPKFLPLGGGLGSFLPIYTANEPLGDVKPTFVNNAHSDFLELLLEAGVLGLVVEVAVIATLAWCWWRLARLQPSSDRSLGLAGLIVAILFLAHSAVDYPLRRMACAATFSLAIALVVRPLLRRAAPLPARVRA